MKKKIWNYINDNLILNNIFSSMYYLFMNNRISGKKNNSICFKGAYLKNNKIRIRGNGNQILIKKGVRLNNCIIRINGNNCILRISEHTYAENVIFHFENNGCNIHIGYNCIFNGGEFASVENNSSISIGNQCLFSRNVDITTTDSHSILDRKNLNRINKAKDVVICNNVWIGANVSVLKGSKIPSGCVVGRNALITKEFNIENCILAGVPAKIIKEDILWKAERI